MLWALGGVSPPCHLALLPAVNDVQDAVRSVSSYMLFDPADTVMQQNLVYYRFHRERWRLREEDFEPRPVRTPQPPVPWLCADRHLTQPLSPTVPRKPCGTTTRRPPRRRCWNSPGSTCRMMTRYLMAPTRDADGCLWGGCWVACVSAGWCAWV